MSFTGHENQSIPLAEASQLTADFRSANPGARLGGYFSKDALETILAQPECVGIRYYNALKDGVHTVVVVGVVANEDDLYLGEIADFAKPCPPFPPNLNPLNS